MSQMHATPDDEVIDLEPTMSLELEAVSQPGHAGIALVQGSIASLGRETGDLRRSRIAAAAFLLMLVYLALFIWNFSTLGSGIPTVWIIMATRFLLAGSVLGLLLSPIGSSARSVRFLEFVLFGGLTILLVLSQYKVNEVLLGRGDVPGVVAFVKNGVIQAILLIILFGMFVPNPPKLVAWSALGMALSPLIAATMLSEEPALADAIARFRSVEATGTNIVFLLLAAGVSIFGSMVLNGLRSELHEAKKFGQYRLLNRIGAGGMGEVYLAEHALLKRPCALKLIKPEAGADPLALARFEREVQSSARLAHHNTIEIYDYGHTDDGTFYYVMEYLRGLSLADLIQREGSIPPGRLIYLFRQVCAGLSEAHMLGLVHRDLKPANVYIARLGGETDVAKVLDFGLVKITQGPEAVALTAEMRVSGTPLYMAPEQAMADRSLDARADVYALGAMMYHAATGRPPFGGETPFAVMMAHVRDDLTPPSEIKPEIPADLEAVILKCLAKKPADRYQSVRDIGDDLAACACAADWNARKADEWWSGSFSTPVLGDPATGPTMQLTP